MTSRPTILVVEPLAVYQDLLRLWLAPLGRIVTAGDDDEALGHLRKEPASLVIARHPPSNPDRVGVCEALRRDPSLAQLPVILLAGGERPDQHAAAVRAGADDVLTRPLDRMSLLGAVRRLLDRSAARGLPRITVDTPVRLASEGTEAWGTARNVSRGGIFVEAEATYPPGAEVQLEFPLPDRRAVLEPTAAVVWIRLPTREVRPGMGLRFLGLDGPSARSLEHFVREHHGAPPPPRMEVP